MLFSPLYLLVFPFPVSPPLFPSPFPPSTSLSSPLLHQHTTLSPCHRAISTSISYNVPPQTMIFHPFTPSTHTSFYPLTTPLSTSAASLSLSLLSSPYHHTIPLPLPFSLLPYPHHHANIEEPHTAIPSKNHLLGFNLSPRVITYQFGSFPAETKRRGWTTPLRRRPEGGTVAFVLGELRARMPPPRSSEP